MEDEFGNRIEYVFDEDDPGVPIDPEGPIIVDEGDEEVVDPRIQIIQNANLPANFRVPAGAVFADEVNPVDAARQLGVPNVVPYAYQFRHKGKPVGRRVRIYIPGDYANKRPADIGAWLARTTRFISQKRRTQAIERRFYYPGTNLKGRTRQAILREAGLPHTTNIPAGVRLVGEYTSNEDARDVYGGLYYQGRRTTDMLLPYRYKVGRSNKHVMVYVPAELDGARPQTIGAWIARNTKRVQAIRRVRRAGERHIGMDRPKHYEMFPFREPRESAITGVRGKRPTATTSDFSKWVNKNIANIEGTNRTDRERSLVYKLKSFENEMRYFKSKIQAWGRQHAEELMGKTPSQCLEWSVSIDPRQIVGRERYTEMVRLTKDIAHVFGDLDALDYSYETQFTHRVKSIMSNIIVQGLYPVLKEMVRKSEGSIAHPEILRDQLTGGEERFLKIRPALSTSTNRGTWTMFNSDFLSKIKGSSNRSALDSFTNLDVRDPTATLTRFYAAMQYDPIMRIEEYGSDSIYSAFRVLPQADIDQPWEMKLFFLPIRDRPQRQGSRVHRQVGIRDPNNVSRHLGGRYASFKHTLDGVDLLPLQIHHVSEKFNKDIDGYPCFVYACLMSGLFSQEEIDFMLVHYIHVQEVKLNQIKAVCDKFQVCFKIYEHRNERTNVYGKEYEDNRTVEMVLFKGHYAIERRFPITMFALRNPQVVRRYGRYDISREASIGSPTFAHENQWLRTRSLLTQLDKLNYLTPLETVDLDALHQNFIKISDVCQSESLEYPSITCPKYEAKPNRSQVCHPASLFFADFEATSVDANENHQPYMMAVVGNPCNGDSFYRCYTNTKIDSSHFNDDWFLALTDIFIAAHDYMMEHAYSDFEPTLKKGKDDKLPPAYFIYHNLDYDQVFLQRFVGKFSSSDLICCGNRVLGFTYFVWNRPIIFRDSFGYLNVALKNFPKYVPPLREMRMEKEVLPYGFYSKGNVLRLIDYRWASLSDFVQTLLNPEDQEHIRNIASEKGWLWNGFGNQELIDVIAYTEFYCKQDCEVLRIGFMFWQQQVFEFAKIDLIEKCTISGIAYEYMIRQGVFEGCHELSGVPLYFIRKCVNGGRCMLAGNRKTNVEGTIEDFDAVSLYPSAMKRLWTVKGLPKIIPKEWSLDDLRRNSNDFFVEIKVKRVPKHLDFPLLPREVEGYKIYNNEPVDSLYVDNIWLEDLKEFHKIQDEDIDLIRGYYYDQGRNYRIQEAIEHLFNQRLSYKRDKNPIETVVKMLMNSCYGKSILKPIDTTRRVIDKSKLEIEIMDMKAAMIEVTQIDDSDNYIIRKNVAISDIKGFPTLGVQVLSMSKRIMSEVMVTAQDMGIRIYYTDTDSMHIDNSNGELLLLEDEFRRRYQRELVGKAMGQFHCDFDVPEFTEGHWYSSRFIGIGKKCYLDVLRNESYPSQVAFHWRLKGVTKDSFYDAAEKFKNDRFPSAEEAIMTHLFEGGECEFDLMVGGRCSFKNSKGMGKYTIEDFTRRVRFEERGSFYVEYIRTEGEELID